MALHPSFKHLDNEWKARIKARSTFLDKFVSQRELKRDDENRTLTARARTQAAELMLSTNKTCEAVKMLDRTVSSLLTKNTNKWPTTRTALLGALTGRIHLQLGVDEFVLTDIRRRNQKRGQWLAPASVCENTAGPLIVAALNPPPNRSCDLTLLEQPYATNEKNKLAFLITTNSVEAATLPMFGFARQSDGSFKAIENLGSGQLNTAIAAFGALHQRYASILRMIVADEERWFRVCPRCPLIDWTLLALHVAIRRSLDPRVQDKINEDLGAERIVGDIFIFLKEVAVEIDKFTRQGPSA
ncbi:hypothetical protein ABVF61_05930 [Roseibium sp. HPY-6]|uniref:hypothetical protein n=1 Tax=Roseibium sp. HPY-6 TaxID=3229852 RepID=UPI00338FC37A